MRNKYLEREIVGENEMKKSLTGLPFIGRDSTELSKNC